MMNNRIFFQIITLFIISILILACTDTGAIVNVAGPTAIMGLTGKQILDKADKILDDKLHQAEQKANGLINQALTGLSAISEGARNNLKDVLDKPIREMSDFQRQLFINIKEFSDKIEKFGGYEIYKLEEVTNIDISQRLGDLIFSKNAVFISSISGLSVCSWRPNHTITIIATGLGPGEVGKKAEVKFAIKANNGNIDLVPNSIDLSKHNQGSYTFDISKFKAYFSNTSIKTLDLITRLTIEKKGLLRKNVKTVESHIVLSLYPVYAGKIMVEYAAPIYGWSFIERKTESRRTADCGGGRCGGGGRIETFSTTHVPNGEQSTNPPIGARKVENPGIQCGPPWWDPEGCRYVYVLSARVNPTRQYVIADWRVTGVWVTMHISYDIYEWRRIREDPKQIVLELKYDRIVDFCLPESVDYYKIKGELLTNDKFELAPGQSHSNILSYSGGFNCEGNGTRHAYNVKSPI